MIGGKGFLVEGNGVTARALTPAELGRLVEELFTNGPPGLTSLTIQRTTWYGSLEEAVKDITKEVRDQNPVVGGDSTKIIDSTGHETTSEKGSFS